jgi:hypothetical protein
MVNGIPTSNYEYFFSKIYQVVQGSYDVNGVQLSKGAINPIVLSAENGDDIVVTFFSLTGDSRRATNTCTSPATVQHLERFTPNPPSRYTNPVTHLPNHGTRFTDGQVMSMVDGCAPNAGVLLVEVFYNYHQILKMGSFLQDNEGHGILDPILVHAYSVMPLSAAEPTPTP